MVDVLAIKTPLKQKASEGAHASLMEKQLSEKASKLTQEWHGVS